MPRTPDSVMMLRGTIECFGQDHCIGPDNVESLTREEVANAIRRNRAELGTGPRNRTPADSSHAAGHQAGAAALAGQVLTCASVDGSVRATFATGSVMVREGGTPAYRANLFATGMADHLLYVSRPRRPLPGVASI